MRTLPKPEEETDEERYERLLAFGLRLIESTDDPAIKEKIAAVLRGESVNH